MTELTPESIIAEWNRYDALPTSRLTDKRKVSLAKRIAEHPDIKTWVDGIRYIATTPFYLGKGQGQWKATFDFISERRDKIQSAAERASAVTPEPEVHVPSRGTETRESAERALRHTMDEIHDAWSDTQPRRLVFWSGVAARMSEIEKRWPV